MNVQTLLLWDFLVMASMFGSIWTEDGQHMLGLLVEEDLQVKHEQAVSDVIMQINNSLLELSGERSTLAVETVASLDTYSIFARSSDLKKEHTDENTTFALSLAMKCPHCPSVQEVMHRQDFLCSVICYDSLIGQWDTCLNYTLKGEAYRELLKKLLGITKKLVFFYDKGRESSLKEVLDLVTNYTRTILWESNYVEQSFTLRMSESNIRNLSHFIISTNVSIAQEILRQSQNIKVLGPEYNWLIDVRNFNTDTESLLSTFMEPGDNIALITSVQTAFSAGDLAQKCGALAPRHYHKERKKNITLIHVKKCMKDCRPPAPLTRVSFVTSCGHVSDVSKIFSPMFQGFGGRNFKIVTKTYSPFVKLKKYENGTEVYSGLVIELLDSLAETLNFRYNVMEVPDGKFGIRENNTWNGMIGMVDRKVVDMAASGITINLDREQVVDFTYAFWEEPSAVLVRRTTDGTAYYWVYRPLHWYVWLTIIAAIIFMTLILWGFTHLSNHLFFIMDPMEKMLHGLWYIFGAFFQQGGFHLPQTPSGRLAASAWWIVVIIMYGIYTGNLIAFLSVTKLSLPFDSLKEMTSQNEYKYGAEDGIIQVMLFQTAESGIYHDIWRGMESSPGSILQDSEAGFTKAKNEKFGYIGDKTFLEANSVEDCDLTLIKEEFYKVGFGLAVQEGWPYKKYFDDAILKLLEGGFVERWRREHWPTDKCGIKEKYVESRSITLEDLSGNFCTLLLGIVLSVFALLFEKTLGKYKLKLASRNSMNLNQSNSSTANMLQFEEMRKREQELNLTQCNSVSGNMYNPKTSQDFNTLSIDNVMCTVLHRKPSKKQERHGVERSHSGQSIDIKSRNGKRHSFKRVCRESQRHKTYTPKNPLELL